MKKITLFLVLFFLIVGAATGFLSRKICPRYDAITSGRVIDFACELEKKAHMNQVILFRCGSDPLCLSNMTKDANVQKISVDTFLITINKNLVDKFSDSELKSVIAHELGHIFWGNLSEHPTINNDDDRGEVLNRHQAQADAFVIHFMGVDSLRKNLEMIGCQDALVYYRISAAKKIAQNWPK